MQVKWHELRNAARTSSGRNLIVKKLTALTTMLMLTLVLPGCDKEDSNDSGPRVEPERLNQKADVADHTGGRVPTPQQLGNTNDKGQQSVFGGEKGNGEKCGCESTQSSVPAPSPAPAPAPASAPAK
jgi:hypothetical protein